MLPVFIGKTMGIGGIYANEVPDGGTFEAGDNILVARGPYVVAVPKDELPSGGGDSVTVVDNLESTSTTSALSAKQGKVLNDRLADYATVDNQRYQFVTDDNTTYTVPASAVTANGNTIIELSNNSLTSITINTATGTGKTAGDSVHISITGTYAAQVLVAGAGVTLQGDLTFSYQYQTKTLIYKGSNTWKVVG